MSKKLRELEANLGQKDREIEILTRRIQELSNAVNASKEKESAIVGALMEAKATAERIISNANHQAGNVVQEADAIRKNADELADKTIRSAREEAEKIIEESNGQAAVIIEKAHAEAKRRLEQAEYSACEYTAALDRLNGKLAQTAGAARKYAEEFAEMVSLLTHEGDKELAQECKGLPGLLESSDEKQSLPEQYQNPADLMRSIYMLQGRETPRPQEDFQDEAAKPLNAQEDTNRAPEDDKVWTVDEVVASPATDNAAKDAELDDELNALIEDVLNED